MSTRVLISIPTLKTILTIDNLFDVQGKILYACSGEEQLTQQKVDRSGLVDYYRHKTDHIYGPIIELLQGFFMGMFYSFLSGLHCLKRSYSEFKKKRYGRFNKTIF